MLKIKEIPSLKFIVLGLVVLMSLFFSVLLMSGQNHQTVQASTTQNSSQVLDSDDEEDIDLELIYRIAPFKSDGYFPDQFYRSGNYWYQKAYIAPWEVKDIWRSGSHVAKVLNAIAKKASGIPRTIINVSINVIWGRYYNYFKEASRHGWGLVVTTKMHATNPTSGSTSSTISYVK